MLETNIAGTLCIVCNDYQSYTQLYDSYKMKEMLEHTPTVARIRMSGIMFDEVLCYA